MAGYLALLRPRVLPLVFSTGGRSQSSFVRSSGLRRHDNVDGPGSLFHSGVLLDFSIVERTIDSQIVANGCEVRLRPALAHALAIVRLRH